MKEFYDIAKDGISDTKQRHEHFESVEKQKYDLHDELVKAVKNIEKSQKILSEESEKTQNSIKRIAIWGLVIGIVSIVYAMTKDLLELLK
ncbi:MAG: hypothetical protein PHO86_04170 [Bacilli bacterium]|nr:hypothetical protein [Bacilli bacterium]